MSFKEFLGIGGYTRPAEGYMSFEHLFFVSCLTAVMIACAVVFGLRNKTKSAAQKNRVLMVSAVLIDAFELFKIVVLCIRAQNPMEWVYVLPLFLCSIQLITIPLAAFSKGRLKEASLDFVTIFGVLGTLLGTYFAGNNYSCYPVLSLDNVVSGITHTIAGFSALYIMIAGMASMKKKNIPLTVGILGGFCVAAYVANIFTNSNYMFLLRGDGTPYDILFNLVNGNPVAYPLGVVVLFVLYIAAFYQIFYAITHRRHTAPSQETEQKEDITV